MNIADIIVITIIVILVFFALSRIIKTRKNKGCSCGCSSCTLPCDKKKE